MTKFFKKSSHNQQILPVHMVYRKYKNALTVFRLFTQLLIPPAQLINLLLNTSQSYKIHLPSMNSSYELVLMPFTEDIKFLDSRKVSSLFSSNVASLFTNIPLRKTVSIILDRIYKNTESLIYKANEP